jgi:CBS domain-containing protein
MTTLDTDRWKSIQARDLMHARIASAPLGASTAEIERALADHGVSGLAVRNAEERIVGIVSWRDLVAQSATETETAPRWPLAYFRIADEAFDAYEVADLDDDETRADPVVHDGDHETCAADLMSNELLSVPGDASVADLARLMSTEKVHRLFVTEGDDAEIVGIVSTMDILAALSA